MALITGLVTGRGTQCVAFGLLWSALIPCTFAVVDPETQDVNHPRNYVTIREAHRIDSTPFAVYTPQALNTTDPEVDLESRIEIIFDRKWIKDNADRFDGEILVTAELKGEQESSPVEVPGYSLIGQEKKVASVRIRYAPQAADLAEGVRGSWENLVRSINIAQKSIMSQQPEWRKTALAIAGESGSDDWQGESEQLRRFRVDKLTDEKFAIPYATEVRRILLSRIETLTQPLARLTAAESRRAVDLLAKASGQDPESLLAQAKQVLETYVPKLEQSAEDSTTIDSLDEALLVEVAVDDMLAMSRGLAYLSWTEKEEIVQGALDLLKDTDILIPQTRAKVGDRLVVTVVNGADGQDPGRAFSIAMKVARFGVIRETTDSALFIKRLGVSDSANEETVDDARDDATTDGVPTSVETPNEVNFAPAPGASLAWTYRPRRSKKFWRALQPGVGFNVSFMKFDSTVSSFAPSGGGGAATAEFQNTSDEIDVGAGVLFGLFDNALQMTYGWNLTADDERNYFGIGFSFVKVIEKAREAKDD